MTNSTEAIPASTADRARSPSYGSRIQVLAFVGALVSLYLIYHHVEVNGNFSTGPTICDFGGTFSCSDVARSPFAEFLGLPVAAWGFLYYVVVGLFIGFARPGLQAEENTARKYANAVFALAVLGLVPALGLFGVSAVIIGRLCLFCSVLYVLNIFLAVIALRDPLRDRRFGASFFDGIASFGSFLMQGSLSTEFKLGAQNTGLVGRLLFAALLLATATLAFAAPSTLRTQWFEPRRKQLTSHETLEPVVKTLLAQRLVPNLENKSSDLNERDFSYGPDDAALTIVEFIDFGCPYCKRASGVLKKITADFPGKVRVVFKNYPLDPSCNRSMEPGQGHDLSCKAAELLRCAGQQGVEQFWKTHDGIFALPTITDPELDALPYELGLDSVAIETCLTNGSGMERVKQDVEQAISLQLQGTPSMFLNGRQLASPRLETLPGVVALLLEKEAAKR